MSLDFKSLMGAGASGDSAGGSSILGGNAAQAAMGIDTSCLPSLTLQQRVTAFCVCFGIGMLISFCSSFMIISASQCCVATPPQTPPNKACVAPPLQPLLAPHCPTANARS